MFSLKDAQNVADIRGYGHDRPRSTSCRTARPGSGATCLQKKLFDNGLNLKTTGDSAIIAPPLHLGARRTSTAIADILRTHAGRALQSSPQPNSNTGDMDEQQQTRMASACRERDGRDDRRRRRASAQQKEVTIGYQDMLDPYRIAQDAKEIEKATGYKINWKQFGGGGEVIKAMASGAVQLGEVGSAGIAAAVSRGEPYELFWILDDIGDAEALVAKNGSGINIGQGPEGQEDRDAVQLDDALPHDGRARAGRRRIRPTCRSSTCGRPKCARRGSAATSRRRGSGIPCCPK